MAAALLPGVTTKSGQHKPESGQHDAEDGAPANQGSEEVRDGTRRDVQEHMRSFRWGCVGGAWSRFQVWRTGCWKVESLLD